MKLLFWDRERTEGSPLGPFMVRPTKLRFGAKTDYLVQVNPQVKAKLGRRAIVSDVIPADKPKAGPKKARAVLANVMAHANLGENNIRLDQTLREALNVEPGDKVYLYKLIGGSAGWILDRLFKPKRLWAYAFRSYRRDMEKDLCGMGMTTMNILGLKQRDRLKIEYVFFDQKDNRFKIGVATPAVFELPADDLKNTIDQINQDIVTSKDPVAKKLICSATEDIQRPRVIFIRLDKDLRITLANENLKIWRMRQESESSFSEERLNELPLLASVRLSPSLPFILKSRSVFHGLNAFIGMLVTIIAYVEVSIVAGTIIGIVYFMVLLSTIFWDIRGRIS